jgi:2-keto-4-pentenoate hydratase
MTQADAGDRLAAIAGQIIAYRRDGVQLPADAPRWAIATEAEADAIQDRVAAGIDEPVVGWKMGATDEAGRTRLNLTKPFIGRVFQSRLWHSPAVLNARSFPSCIPESELGFRLGTDLPPRDQPYTSDELRTAISSCHPVFEIVDFTWPSPAGLSGVDFLADNGACAGMVVGAPIPLSQMSALAGHRVSLSIDGQLAGEGITTKSYDQHLELIAWLANHLSVRQIGLRKNQIVATGNLTGMPSLYPGQTAVADYGALGAIQVSLRDLP